MYCSPKVFVWTSYRSMSNAFERSLRNLDNTKVIHEPYARSFYFSEDRGSTCFQDRPPIPSFNYNSVSSEIQQEFEGVKSVFIKDMASHIYPDFEMLLDEGFKGFRHTFLIRHPRKSMVSLHKVNSKLENSVWNTPFDPDEGTGFLRLYSLYKFVMKHLDPNPVVIDADDVVKFPEEMMFSFCRAVGVDYKPEMTQWELGLPKDLEEHFKLYPAEYVSAWAGYVSSSSCFHQTNKHDSDNVQLPEEMEKVVEKSMPCYEDMRKNRIQI